jgi:hypothetical protein
MNAKIVVVAVGVMSFSFGATALAQEAQGSASVQAQATAPPPPPAPTYTAPARVAAPAAMESDEPDHDKFIGRFAVGYLGTQGVPTLTVNGTGNNATLQTGTLTAPVVGIRYWLQPKLGIDAGIGLGWNSVNNTNNGLDTSQFAFVLHGGLPLAFVEGKHYVFELIPEINFGMGSTTIKNPNPAGPDASVSGLLLQGGARVGAEVHFGFIGIPQLALQASVGLFIQHTYVKASSGDVTSQAQGVTGFTTTVGNNPWGIFTDSVAALYYF